MPEIRKTKEHDSKMVFINATTKSMLKGVLFTHKLNLLIMFK